MTQPIWYDSSETGAPTLNNVAGSLLAVLRACLINGFNAKSVTSIAVASGVATATCAAHGFSGTYGKLVLISGSAEPLLNGNKQPGNVLTNSFTFPAPGVADGTYTGTLSAKRAPLGWTEPYSGTNKAIFARSVIEATAMMLRIDDSHIAPSTATDARILMVESATGVDTFTAPSPTDAQLSGGLYWYKGVSNTTPKKWAVFGDDLCVWVMLDHGTTLYMPHLFGDFVKLASVDPYGAVVSGGVSAGNGSTPTILLPTAPGSSRASPGVFVARGASQVGGSTNAFINAFGTATSAIGSFGPPSPSPIDAAFVVHKPVLLSEHDSANSHPIRAALPGCAQPLTSTQLTPLAIYGGQNGDESIYVGLRFSSSAQLLIDVSTPWR